jgi:hypothetical protein
VYGFLTKKLSIKNSPKVKTLDVVFYVNANTICSMYCWISAQHVVSTLIKTLYIVYTYMKTQNIDYAAHSATSERAHLCLPLEVKQWFQAAVPNGAGYLSYMRLALSEYISGRNTITEQALRQVIREELQKWSKEHGLPSKKL